MAEPKIVDAVSVPLNNSADTNGVKIDASGLAKALQSIIAENTPVETTKVNPADYIKDAGEKMVSLYSVYEKLRAIGLQLNGKLMSDPIPETLLIEDITINFRIVEDKDKEPEKQSVSLKHITTIGDISGILSTELGSIIVLLQQETDGVLDIAKRTKELCDKSRKAWEETNKDKKIQELDAAGNPITGPDAPQGPETATEN